MNSVSNFVMTIYEQLLSDPHHFKFYQAVRLLKSLTSDGDQISFENNPHLYFSPCAIEKLEHSKDEDEAGNSVHFTVTVPFMGTLGVGGTNPVFDTETAREGVLNQEPAFADWYNLFTNRAVALHFAGWRKSKLPVHYESKEDDQFTPRILALSGLGTPHLIENLGFLPDCPAAYGGRLSNPRRSAVCIEDLVGDYFQVPCTATPWVERIERVPDGYLTELGISNSILGSSFFVGDRFTEYTKTFRVTLGPLSYEEFQNFLPVGEWRNELESLLRFIAGIELAYEIQLVLKSAEVPPWAENMMLGWNTWIYSTEPSTDDSQTIFG